MDGTYGASITENLDSILIGYELKNKTLGCEYGGGSNLSTCYKHLTGKASCDMLGFTKPGTGRCLAHMGIHFLF